MMRAILLALSRSRRMQSWTMRSRLTRSTVDRFIAGNTLDAAVVNGRRLNDLGILLTMDHVGEAVSDEPSADVAAREYHEILHRIPAEALKATISVKPSQLGLALDPARCGTRFHELVAESRKLGIMVEIDMEDSPYTDTTLAMYRELLGVNPALRVCLQAYLRRCNKDIEDLIALKGSVRLVKGAYKEPASIAFQKKSEVDDNYVRLMEAGLSKRAVDNGFYLAIATHDESLVEIARQLAANNGIGKDKFEFQFLYGVRFDLQQQLAADGYTVRVYLPYGQEWYPYFMRRLAERPANVLFILRALLRGPGAAPAPRLPAP